MDNLKIPYVSDEIIRYLEAVFPDGLPQDQVYDLSETNFKIGQQHVIRHLQEIAAHQTEESFNV